MVRTGQVREAADLLASAGDEGDSSALFELAIWRLAGTPIPRDLASARSLLRRAVSIGHVDAALIEVALTANGSGGPTDWRSARELLERAAATDTVAGGHLALLRKMAIDADGLPQMLPAPKTLNAAPLVQCFEALCTADECRHVAETAVGQLAPATVFDPASGRMVAHPIRSSDNAAIGPTQESLVIQAINRRIAAATRTEVTQGEPLTVLRYGPGQQYRLHLDTLPAVSNQRVCTAILYLNDSYAGGETIFPELGVTIRARTGDLLIFANVDRNGAPEPRSRHAGLPVTAGTKWIATRWIRAQPITAWQLSDEARAAARG